MCVTCKRTAAVIGLEWLKTMSGSNGVLSSAVNCNT